MANQEDRFASSIEGNDEYKNELRYISFHNEYSGGGLHKNSLVIKQVMIICVRF